MKFTSRFVNKVSDWLHVKKIANQMPTLQSGLCISFELLNIATNFRSPERSLEHSNEK